MSNFKLVSNSVMIERSFYHIFFSLLGLKNIKEAHNYILNYREITHRVHTLQLHVAAALPRLKADTYFLNFFLFFKFFISAILLI